MTLASTRRDQRDLGVSGEICGRANCGWYICAWRLETKDNIRNGFTPGPGLPYQLPGTDEMANKWIVFVQHGAYAEADSLQ